MSSNDRDPTDSLDSLFADALKAVEKKKKVTPKEQTPSESDDGVNMEFDIEVEIDADFEIDSDSLVEAAPVSTVNSEDYEALLEEKAHLDLQYDQLRQRLRSLQGENERMNQRLASAHTHMQTAQGQLKKLRTQNQTMQTKIDDKDTRIRLLEGTVERQKQQIEKNGSMRRKEQQEMKKYGASSTLKQLLPALDSLDLAVKNSDADPESLKDGLRLLHAQFTDALSSAGVVRVSSNPGDKFNPAHHEAVMRIPSDTVPANHIVESFCGAYTLHERLLRAAMVSVASPQK